MTTKDKLVTGAKKTDALENDISKKSRCKKSVLTLELPNGKMIA